jgi:hypothetical protein
MSAPSWTKQKKAKPPAGKKDITDFGDGSFIVEGDDGKLSFVDQLGGYSTDNMNIISEIVETKGGRQRAGDIYRGEAAQEAAGQLATRAMSLSQGVPFLREYIEPAAALARSVTQGMPISTTLNTAQEAVARREQEAPKTVAASRLGMGITAAAPFAPALTAKSMLGKIAQSGLYGSALTGLEGLVSGIGKGLFETGTLSGAAEEGLAQAESGAKIGGGLGLISPPIAGAVGGLYGQYLREPVKDLVEKIGFKKDAAKVVEDSLAMDAATAVESAESSGPYGSIATLGPNTTALLDVVANSPSEGARIARANLRETASDASSDLFATLDDVLGTPTAGIKTQKEKIMTDSAKVRRELYGSAYDFEITPDTEGGAAVIALFNRVDPSDLAGARTLLREAGEASDFIGGRRVSEGEVNDVLNSLTPQQRQGLSVSSNADGTYTISRAPTVASIDYVTRRLYGEAEALRRIGNDPAAASKRNLAIQLRAGLDDINPDYAAARRAGKDAIDQKLAADLGNDILNPRVTREDVAVAMEGMDEVMQAQLRQALRNRIDEISANAKVNPRADNDQEVVEALAALKTLNTRAVATKLEMALGEEAAAKIGEQIRDTSSALMQHASVALGSKTAIRQMVMERMKEIAGEPISAKIGKQGPIGTAAEMATAGLLGGPSQQNRVRALASEIAPVLTQRMTPEDLMRQAQMMEQMTGYIDRANAGARAAESLTRGGALGYGMSQTREGEASSMEQLLNQLRAGSYPR